MTKRTAALLLTTVFVLCIGLVGHAQQTIEKIRQAGVIKVGMTGNQPPYTMEAKDGSLMGFEVDLAELLAESMNIKLEVVRLPFKDLMPALEKGSIDAIMSGMTITMSRNTRAAFVGPYLLSGKSILTKMDVLAKADETEDLNQADLNLTALSGSTSEKFIALFLPEANYTPSDNYDIALQMLRNDEVHALVADYAVCMLDAIRYTDEGFVTLADPLNIEPIGMALPPSDPLLMNFMENYINALEMSGILAELEAYWFENGDWLSEIK